MITNLVWTDLETDMINKYFCYLISICIVFSISAGATTLPSDKLQNYIEACNLMKQGIEKQDKPILYSSMDLFDRLDIVSIPDTSIRAIDDKNALRPTLFFIPEFIDELILHNFELAKLDEASLLRNNSVSADISVSHHGIKAEKSMLLEIEGNSHMEILIVSSGNAAPQIEVKDKNNGKIIGNYSSSGSSSWIIWDMDNPGWFELKISNMDKSDETFVIAIN